MKRFTGIAAALSFVLAAALVRPAVAETTQHYAFVGGTFLGNDYLEMAKNAKNSSEISDIRRQILQSESLSKEEKVSLINQVSDVQVEKIDSEYKTERNWIIAEGIVSATIRGLNLGFNKNPASAGAVDAFAESILQGDLRATIVQGYETGDWSGFEQIAQSVGAGWVLGKGLDLFGKIPQVQNAASKAVDWLGNLAEKIPGFRNQLRECAIMEANLWDDLNSTLKPQLGEAQAEMAELYRQISRAGTEAEKNVLRKELALLENEVAQLRNQIVRKEAEIAAAERLFSNLEYTIRDCVKQVGNKVDTYILDRVKIPFLGLTITEAVEQVADNIDHLCISIGDLATEQIVQAQMAIAERAFDVAEAEYRNRLAEIDAEFGEGNVVLKGEVSVDVYVDGEGEYGGPGAQNGNGENGDIVRDRTNDGLRPGTEQDGPVHNGRYDGVDGQTQTVLDAIFDALGWSLDEKTTGDIIDVIVDAIKNGGTKLDQYEQKIGDMLPGDNAKQTLETLLDKVLHGDFNDIKTTIQDFGQAVALDYTTGLVIDMGLVEGMPVMDIQNTLQTLIASGYDTGVSFVEVLNQAINGGCFGNGTGAQGISATIQNGQVVLVNGGIVGNISGITPAGVWGTIKSKIQTIVLPKLEEFAAKQLDKWIAKNPTVKKWLTEIFGIDGRSIVNGLKNIWGVLTSNGTLSEKFSKLVEMAQNALCDMAKHALQWGLGKLQSWLSNIANKLISKVVNWLANKLQRLLGKFGITIPQNLINKVQAWLQAQVGKGVQKVVDVLDKAGGSIIDQFRPKGGQGGGGGQQSVWRHGQQQPQPQTR